MRPPAASLRSTRTAAEAGEEPRRGDPQGGDPASRTPDPGRRLGKGGDGDGDGDLGLVRRRGRREGEGASGRTGCAAAPRAAAATRRRAAAAAGEQLLVGEGGGAARSPRVTLKVSCVSFVAGSHSPLLKVLLSLNTISSDLSGAPFGNVVSYSDGLPGEGRGIPYFYLTTLDPTARDALEDERASFTLSEFPLGTCGKIDPENPTCAKLTLTGKLKLVDLQSSEAELAKSALFTKHPEMKDWPKNHHFKIFKLEIENIFLIDWFGGAKPITPSQYLEFSWTNARRKLLHSIRNEQ
ncbi:hypothetical protein U9M48_039143 [Paspalum notatum var. saurae]|uniref:CREG-like beta-barrel domain-containing protein n=1 Tax=Paspalum notatum var. saurae TaxID=547442 RepID=A0AAQ3UNC3_PASNO